MWLSGEFGIAHTAEGLNSSWFKAIMRWDLGAAAAATAAD